MPRRLLRRGLDTLAGGAALLAACSGSPEEAARATPERPPVLSAVTWLGESAHTPPAPEGSEPFLVAATYEARSADGPTIALAARYRVPLATEQLYGGDVQRATLVVAVELESGRTYAASADPPQREDAVWQLDPEGAAASADSVLSASGAFNADLRALLDLPGEPAEYDVFLWLGELTSVPVRVTLPASAAPGRAVARRSTPRARLAPSVVAPPSPVARPSEDGCLTLEVDVARAGAGPLVIMAAVPELLAVRAHALPIPAGDGAGVVVGIDLCDLVDELPPRPLDVHALALRGGHASAVATLPWYPTSPVGARLAPAPPCRADDECVLVTGGCVGPAGAHVRVAEEVDEHNRLIAASAECSGAGELPAVRPACRAGRCIAAPVDRPEWRACHSDRDCVAVLRACESWEAVHRRFEDDARAAWERDDCARAGRGSPPLVCRYGDCLSGWAGGR